MGEATIQDLFDRLRAGDDVAKAELFQRLYDELHNVARAEMARQERAHTLQPTALVNEAYMKLCRKDGGELVDRAHFVRLAATAMRQVLVDHARKKRSQKRSSGGERVEFDDLVLEYERKSGDLVALDAALQQLEERDPELVRLVELRFFVGHSVPEVASILNLSARSAARRWQTARLYLKGELRDERV